MKKIPQGRYEIGSQSLVAYCAGRTPYVLVAGTEQYVPVVKRVIAQLATALEDAHWRVQACGEDSRGTFLKDGAIYIDLLP